MALSKIPETNVHGDLLEGASTGHNIVVPKSGKRMMVIGFRMQIYEVTTPGTVEFVGNQGTKISERVYADANGMNYVQDRIRVPLGQGEKIKLVNTTDGNVRWAVFIEEFASADKDGS